MGVRVSLRARRVHQRLGAALHEELAALPAHYREPIVLCDLQGPKLRVGQFKDGKAVIRHSGHFTFDRDPTPGDENRVCLPHPELFGVLRKGQRLLIDDGKNAPTSVGVASAVAGAVRVSANGLLLPECMTVSKAVLVPVVLVGA